MKNAQASWKGADEPFINLIEKRKIVLREMEKYARQRDAVVARARDC